MSIKTEKSDLQVEKRKIKNNKKFMITEKMQNNF